MKDILGLIKMMHSASLESPKGFKNSVFVTICLMVRLLIKGDSITSKES